MTKVVIWGAGGRMGQVLSNMARNDGDIEFICGVDKFCQPQDFNYPIVNDPNKVQKEIDVVIDFSRPEALDSVLQFAKKKECGVVLATTGYTDEDIKKIEIFSKTLPAFRSYNMSLGVNLLCDIVTRAARILEEKFDIEIIEKHHNQKVDAPSGTAIMLANAVNEAFEEKKNLVFGRQGTSAKRQREIGIHAVRGGTIVGQHDVVFAGHNEVITFSHQAESKEIFASGALKAAKFLKGKKRGLYSMKDIFQS